MYVVGFLYFFFVFCFFFFFFLPFCVLGAVVVVIEWSLDLQLSVQSVPITTKVVSSNPAHRRGIFDITLCDKVCDMQVSGFLRVLRFRPPIKLTITV